MPALTAYGEAYQLDALLAKWAADGVTTYVALTTTAPTKASAGTPATGVTREAATFTRSGDAISNSATVDFGDSTASESLVGFEVYDAAASGNRILYGLLTGQPVASTAGTPLRIPSGSLTFSPDANS